MLLTRHVWYVAQTHPRAEMKASQHLGRQGFEVYLPRYLKKRRHARRTDTIAAPLYPGYLFVAIDLETSALAFDSFNYRSFQTCLPRGGAGRYPRGSGRGIEAAAG